MMLWALTLTGAPGSASCAIPSGFGDAMESAKPCHFATWVSTIDGCIQPSVQSAAETASHSGGGGRTTLRNSAMADVAGAASPCDLRRMPRKTSVTSGGSSSTASRLTPIMKFPFTPGFLVDGGRSNRRDQIAVHPGADRIAERMFDIAVDAKPERTGLARDAADLARIVREQ